MVHFEEAHPRLSILGLDALDGGAAFACGASAQVDMGAMSGEV